MKKLEKPDASATKIGPKSQQDVIEKFGLRDVRTKALEAKVTNLAQERWEIRMKQQKH